MSKNVTGGLSRRSFVAGAVCLTAGLAAASATGAALADGAAAEGTKTVSATRPGFGGDVTVTLTVDTASGKVTDVAIEGPDETPSRGGRAIENAQAAMLDSESIEFEATAGASATSSAIADAAQAAYNEAMGVETSSVVKMKPGKYTAGAKGY